MSRDTPTDLGSAMACAAVWIDRLKGADKQDLEELGDWLHQSNDHLEEFLCAVAIDLAIHALPDSDSPSWARPAVGATAAVDSVRLGACILPARALIKIRACASATIGDDCAIEDVVNRVLERMSPLSGDMDVTQVERQAIDITRSVSRAWLQERDARWGDDGGRCRGTLAGEDDRFHVALASLRDWLSPFGARQAEIFVCTRLLGHSVRHVALSMSIGAPAVKEELSRVFLHVMSVLEEGQTSDSSKAYRR